MLSYKLFPVSNLVEESYKTQNTPNVSLVELTNSYIKLKKFIPKSSTSTKCNFHFVDNMVPIQLKHEALPFTYFEHIWNVSAILNWDNKGILQRLGILFSIHNVTDIYPEIRHSIVEYKILENQDVTLFYVKDLQFRVKVVYDENNTYEITFKEMDGTYRPYLISDIPQSLWLYLMDKYDEEVEIAGDIEIKYNSNSYYLSFKVIHNDTEIQEEYV